MATRRLRLVPRTRKRIGRIWEYIETVIDHGTSWLALGLGGALGAVIYTLTTDLSTAAKWVGYLAVLGYVVGAFRAWDEVDASATDFEGERNVALAQANQSRDPDSVALRLEALRDEYKSWLPRIEQLEPASPQWDAMWGDLDSLGARVAEQLSRFAPDYWAYWRKNLDDKVYGHMVKEDAIDFTRDSMTQIDHICRELGHPID